MCAHLQRRLPWIVVSALLVGPVAPGMWAQAAPPRQAPSASNAAQQSGLAELHKRLEAAEAAKNSGDAKQVADASKSLVAFALFQIGDLRAAEVAWPQALLLYNKGLELEYSPAIEHKRDDASAHAKGLPAPEAETAAEPTAGMLAHAHLSAARVRALQAEEKQLRQMLANGYNDWGTAEARGESFAEALALFEKGAQWNPGDMQISRNAGMAAFRAGDYAESARMLQSVVEHDAADDQSRVTLGMSLFSLGKLADADKAFKPSPNAAMQDPRTAYAWAYSLAHTNQQPEANRILDAITAKPLPADVLTLVCHVYMDTENYEHAAPCFQKAAAEDASLKKAHYGAGEALIRLDRPADAVAELRDEVRISPDDPQAKYLLAYALLQTSHKNEADALLRAVVTAEPRHAEAQYELGKLLLEQGQTTEAIQHLELAEEANPAPDYIHYQLQAAYRRAGRTADADRELKVYRAIKEKHRDTAPQHGG